MSTSFQIMTCGAVALAVSAVLGDPAAATVGGRHIVDGCEVGGGGNDIHSVQSSYDADRNEMVVTLRLCSAAERNATYRLHLDHAAPFVEEAGAAATCDRPADSVVVSTSGGHRGVGTSEVQGNLVRFVVPLDELDIGAPEDVPLIALWAESRLRGTVDRAPNRETGDHCAQPQAHTEALVQPRVAISNLIWVGRTPFMGTIRGRFQEEGDVACAQEAHDAGLTGSFVALFSSPTTSGIVKNVRPTLGPFSTADGTMVALNLPDLFDCTKGPSGHDCLRAPINLSISGTRVQVLTWTGSNIFGEAIVAPTCNHWTSSFAGDTGDGGHVDRVDAAWVTGNIGPCDQIRYLICLQLTR